MEPRASQPLFLLRWAWRGARGRAQRRHTCAHAYRGAGCLVADARLAPSSRVRGRPFGLNAKLREQEGCSWGIDIGTLICSLNELVTAETLAATDHSLIGSARHYGRLDYSAPPNTGVSADINIFPGAGECLGGFASAQE
jgi:hypothetical protein